MDKQSVRKEQTVNQIIFALTHGQTVCTTGGDVTVYDAMEWYYSSKDISELKALDLAMFATIQEEPQIEPLQKIMREFATEYALHIVDDVIEHEDNEHKQAQAEDNATWRDM